MSIGLLRVLVQHKLVPQDKLEKYQSAISADKNILPMIFDDGVISPENLVSLLSSVFNYPILDLNYYPRSGIVRDIMDEQHMQKLRCIPIFKRGRRVFMAVSDPTQLQNIQKALFSSGLNVDLVLVRNDQLERLLEWFGHRLTGKPAKNAYCGWRRRRRRSGCPLYSENLVGCAECRRIGYPL